MTTNPYAEAVEAGAPDSVVMAVMEALGCEPIFGPNGGECGEHRFWDSRGCVHAAEAADAAWVASLNAAAERAEEAAGDTGEAQAMAARLRRWADESEANRG